MRRLLILLLTAALATPAAATASVEWATPAALRGHWVTGAEQCNAFNISSHLRITDGRFFFGSQVVRPYGLRRSGSNGHVVDLVSTVDDRQRTTTTVFTLSQRGQRMTALTTVENGRRITGRAISYRKCA